MRSVLDGASVTRASINQTTKEKLEDPYRREAIQILQVHEDILTSRQLKERRDNPHTEEKPFKCLKFDVQKPYLCSKIHLYPLKTPPYVVTPTHLDCLVSQIIQTLIVF